MFSQHNDWVLWARNRAYNMKTGDIIYLSVEREGPEESPVEVISIRHVLGTNQDASTSVAVAFKDPYLQGFILPWIKKNCGKAIHLEFSRAIKYETDRIMGIRSDTGIES